MSMASVPVGTTIAACEFAHIVFAESRIEWYNVAERIRTSLGLGKSTEARPGRRRRPRFCYSSIPTRPPSSLGAAGFLFSGCQRVRCHSLERIA